ncbi:MAG: serine hydrolase domain-containing protein [Promethearchaeota archaeon]
MLKKIGRHSLNPVNSSNPKFKIFISVLILFQFFLASSAIFATANENVDDLELYMQNEKEKSLIPGFAAGVIEQDQFLYAGGVGKANNDNSMVDNSSVFLIGELSQSFTAMGILVLMEDGEINLTDSIQDHIPSFRVADENYSAQITVQQCLYHLSGLPIESGAQEKSEETLSEIVENLADEELIAAPGTRYQFSNANYRILGYLIEQVTGQTYGHFITTRILSPLGMNNTYFSHQTATEDPNFAQGYRLWFGFTVPSHIQYTADNTPSNGMASTITDLLIFIRAHMNPENSSYTRDILSTSSFHLLHTPPTSLAANFTWAMGWHNYTVNGTQFLSISGDLSDYHAKIVINVELEIGVIVLINVNSFIGNVGYYQNLAINVMSFIINRSVYKARFSHFILYLLLDSIIFSSIGREVWKTRKIKSKIQEKINEKLIRKEKVQVLYIEFFGHFLAIALFLFLLPFLIGFIANMSRFNLSFLALLQPDFLAWMIVISVIHLAKAVYKGIVFRKFIK